MPVHREIVKRNIKLVEDAEAVGESDKDSGLYECSYNPIDPVPPPLLLSCWQSPWLEFDRAGAAGAG